MPEEFSNQRERWLAADSTFSALFNDTAALTASSRDLITEMDEAGVDISVALGYGWTDQDDVAVIGVGSGLTWASHVLRFGDQH